MNYVRFQVLLPCEGCARAAAANRAVANADWLPGAAGPLLLLVAAGACLAAPRLALGVAAAVPPPF